jgi:hypothetical protein
MSRKLIGAALTLLAMAALANSAAASVLPQAGTSYYYAGYYGYYPTAYSYYSPAYYGYYPNSYSYYSRAYYSYYPAYYSYYSPSYYYAPVVRYAAPAVVQLQPTTLCPPTYAQPFAAPPSQNKEPPLDKKGLAPPKVTESRSFSPGEDKSILVSAAAKSSCRVGFWNITGRDVTLTVDGKAMRVPANRNVTLTLGREFSWQVEGQASQQERVSEDKAAHEIVLR